MATASLNGITIGFGEAGTGHNVLLLVHGTPFNRSMWHPQLNASISAGWCVIVPDLRGDGESTVAPGNAI